MKRNINQAVGPWRLLWGNYRKDKMAMMGLIIIVIMLFGILIGPELSPHDARTPNGPIRFTAPSREFWMGTDYFGQDILVNLLDGGRRSVSFGFASALVYLSFGIITGGLAGYFGGFIDVVLKRIAEFIQSVPVLPIIIGVSFAISGDVDETAFMLSLMFLYGFLTYPSLFKLVRGQILTLREEEFMKAAEVLGISHFSQIFKHLIPNTIGVVIVAFTHAVTSAILLELTLSFVGIGYRATEFVPPIPTWGNQMPSIQGLNSFGMKNSFTSYYWTWFYPLIMIVMTVGGLKMIGEGIRRAIDPKNN